MKSPKDTYNNNLRNPTIVKDTYLKFLNKYIKNNKNEYFLQMNEGSELNNSKKPFFIPGRIYTFQYDPISKDVLSFYDKRPIIMVHDVYTNPTSKNELVLGINLNFLPEKIRVAVLQFYFEKFKTEINKSEQMHWDDKFYATSSNVVRFLKDWLLQLKIFQSKSISFSFAYRQYIIKRIDSATLIEDDDWGMIPFIQPKDIMGKGLAVIYDEYNKSLMNNLKREKKNITKGKK